MAVTRLFIVVIGLGLALFAVVGVALAEGNVSFGIRPTKAFTDNPQSFSYFVYSLAPGAVQSDEALVINSGDTPVLLQLYAADGITAQNAGVAFTEQGVEARSVRRWLSVATNEVYLQPGEDKVVPFTLRVPPDATPGHHVAGLVVEAPAAGGGRGQFTVRTIQRVGVAVVVDVPGAHISSLEIDGVALKQQDDQGATFVVTVHNTGNVYLKGRGKIVIADREGVELGTFPLALDTVLPGDTTSFQVTLPVLLKDGIYLVSATLDYGDGKIATREGVETKVKNGQPVVDGKMEEVGSRPQLTSLVGTALQEQWLLASQFASSGAAFLALAVALLIIVVVVIIFARRREQLRRPWASRRKQT